MGLCDMLMPSKVYCWDYTLVQGVTFTIYAEHNHCLPRGSLWRIIKLALGSVADLFPRRLWRLSQVVLFRLWFQSVSGFLPPIAMNVWKATSTTKPGIKIKKWSTGRGLTLAQSDTSTFLLIPCNLAREVIGWMMDASLFCYVDSFTRSKTVHHDT